MEVGRVPYTSKRWLAYDLLRSRVFALYSHYCGIDSNNVRVKRARAQVDRLYALDVGTKSIIDALCYRLLDWPERDAYVRANIVPVFEDPAFWDAIAKYPVARRDPAQRLQDEEEHEAIVALVRTAWNDVKHSLDQGDAGTIQEESVP